MRSAGEMHAFFGMLYVILVLAVAAAAPLVQATCTCHRRLKTMQFDSSAQAVDPPLVRRFPNEDAEGPVDAWLPLIGIPPRPPPPYRVALLALWLGDLPPWMDYTARSVSFARELGAAASRIAKNAST